MNAYDEQGNFKIRAYGRQELALLYNPDITPEAAYRKLQRWIDYAPGLRERLDMAGSNKGRTWTPAQVALIVAAIGEP